MRSTRRRTLIGVVLATAVGGWGCTRTAPPDPLEEVASAYVTLVDALAARDGRSLSGDSSITPTRTSRVTPGSFDEIAQRARDTADIVRRLAASPATTERRAWLLMQLEAVETRARQQAGADVPFSEELARLYGLDADALDARPDSDADRQTESSVREARETLDRLLPGRGTAAERLAAIEIDAVVPAPRLPAVFERALAECRIRTTAHLELPVDEHVSVTYVVGEPWSGFSAYQGGNRSTISVNTSYSLTVDRVLQLACHEGYPGHHVLNVLRDQARGKRPELAAVPLFSPEAFATEALASQGANAVFTEAERVSFERDVLFPMAGLPPGKAAPQVQIARLVERLGPSISSALQPYLAGTSGFVETAWALQTNALMQHPRATLDFASQYRGLALAYTGRALPPASPAARWLRDTGYPSGPVIMAGNGHHSPAGSQGR